MSEIILNGLILFFVLFAILAIRTFIRLRRNK